MSFNKNNGGKELHEFPHFDTTLNKYEPKIFIPKNVNSGDVIQRYGVQYVLLSSLEA